MKHGLDRPSNLATTKTLPHTIIREQIIKGIRYLYEDYPFYDKLKQQMRHKRFYIGHYVSAELFQFSRPYLRRASDKLQNKNSEMDLITVYSNKYVGATYLLDQISSKTVFLE
jgi:hypothetical protein